MTTLRALHAPGSMLLLPNAWDYASAAALCAAASPATGTPPMDAAPAAGIFVPGLTDTHLLGDRLSTMDAPLNLLYLPHWHPIDQLAELGVRRVSTGSLLFRAALDAAISTATAIRANAPIPSNPP